MTIPAFPGSQRVAERSRQKAAALLFSRELLKSRAARVG